MFYMKNPRIGTARVKGEDGLLLIRALCLLLLLAVISITRNEEGL